MKKILSVLTSAALLLGMCAALPSSDVQNDYSIIASAEPNSAYNYGEALQKSMFFYQVQQSGPLADWNEVSWRDDAMMTDFVLGGWFDAGDHIKFALTNAYSAAMLAWGVIEYEDGLEQIGILDLYRNNLQYALDFLVGCDLGDEVVYQIGEIDFDHVWWGSAEVYMDKYELKYGKTERDYYTTTDTNVTGEMAAALAAGYIVFKDCNPTLANTYLEHAINCFEIADTARCHGNTPASDAMYKSSHYWDELFWAANWMYMATGDQYYLDLCETDYIPNLGTENQSTELKYTWGHCWDDVQQGGTLLYAINTGDAEWIEQFRKHIEYWTTGYGGKQVTYTPGGLPWLTNWGCLRHATTTAFMAYVASDAFYTDNTAYYDKYVDFADGVMNYCFGDNPLGMSFVVGMSDYYPQAWHHRTSSGAWNDKWSNIGQTEGDDAKPHAHVLYGALVGGPNQNDAYNDNISQYEYTEVACDYNAGYTAALCAMVTKYGGTIDESFPPEEEPIWNEFFMRASINQSGNSYTEIKAYAMNHSAWPARTITDLSYNYYFDITELVDAGLTIDDVSVRIGYDQHSSDKGVMSISDPIQYDGNIYYVKLSFADGSVVMPTGQSEHRSECQFRISIADNLGVTWDASNDYSFQGLVQGGEDAMIDTAYMTMYDGDTLIWGIEPDGTTPSEEPEEPDILYGDANCDGRVNAMDATLAARYAVGTLTLSDQGLLNADVNLDGRVNAMDATLIARYSVGTIASLPV